MKAKFNCLVFLFFLSITYLDAQSFLTNSRISLGVAFQEHDTRLFNFPNQEVLLAQEEDLGTFHYSLNFEKLLLDKAKLKLAVGLGYSFERNTFTRPYYLCFDTPHEEICPYVLRYIDFYEIDLFNFSLNARFHFYKSLFLDLDIKPFFNFIKETKSSGGRNKTQLKQWNYYSTEINPGIGFQFKHLVFKLNYRVFQYKKIDRVIFNTIVYGLVRDDPRLKEKYETYNPFKLWLSVGYKF